MESGLSYSTALMVLGLLALVIDIAVLGFSSFVLTALGLALLLSGLLMLIGLLPETMAATLWAAGILTAALSILLWKPLRNFQNSRGQQNIHNDFTEKQFVLEHDVTIEGLTTYSYSGVQWKLKSITPISAGTLVTIDRAEVGVLWVKEI